MGIQAGWSSPCHALKHTHKHTTNSSYYFRFFFFLVLFVVKLTSILFKERCQKFTGFIFSEVSLLFFFLLHESKLIVAEFWTNEIFEDGFSEQVNFTKTT